MPVRENQYSSVFYVVSDFIKGRHGSYQTLIRNLKKKKQINTSLREKCLYSEFFWFVFSRICAEYGDLNLRIQSEYGKTRTRKALIVHSVHVVHIC